MRFAVFISQGRCAGRRGRSGICASDGGALARGGFDLECAPHGGRSLAHAEQTQAALSFSSGRVTIRIEADPVVRDRQLNQAALLPQAHGHVAGAGVLLDILQGFLKDAVERRLDGGGQAGDPPHAVQVELHARRVLRTAVQAARSTGSRPRSSNALGRRSRAMRRTSSVAWSSRSRSFSNSAREACARAGSFFARVSQRIRMA